MYVLSTYLCGKSKRIGLKLVQYIYIFFAENYRSQYTGSFLAIPCTNSQGLQVSYPLPSHECWSTHHFSLSHLLRSSCVCGIEAFCSWLITFVYQLVICIYNFFKKHKISLEPKSVQVFIDKVLCFRFTFESCRPYQEISFVMEFSKYGISNYTICNVKSQVKVRK